MADKYRAWAAAFFVVATPLAHADHIILDRETLADLTVDRELSCERKLATYVKGGDDITGVSPTGFPGNQCGIGADLQEIDPAVAINALDHQWLRSSGTPQVVDFGSRQKTVFVFASIDQQPILEEALESTVWGSNSSNIADFPKGWQLATLTTIWKKGFEEPAMCEPGENSDDYTGQYSFEGGGFRYIAIKADNSVSIFKDQKHEAWEKSNDDDKSIDGWQSSDNEIDAVGAPTCAPSAINAHAGEDQHGAIGDKLCFNAEDTEAESDIVTYSWDLDSDGIIDSTDDEACFHCDKAREGHVTLYVTDQCGCVATSTAEFHCEEKAEEGGAPPVTAPIPAPTEAPAPLCTLPGTDPRLPCPDSVPVAPGPPSPTSTPSDVIVTNDAPRKTPRTPSAKENAEAPGLETSADSCASTDASMPMLWLVALFASIWRKRR